MQTFSFSPSEAWIQTNIKTTVQHYSWFGCIKEKWSIVSKFYRPNFRCEGYFLSTNHMITETTKFAVCLQARRIRIASQIIVRPKVLEIKKNKTRSLATFIYRYCWIMDHEFFFSKFWVIHRLSRKYVNICIMRVASLSAIYLLNLIFLFLMHVRV